MTVQNEALLVLIVLAVLVLLVQGMNRRIQMLDAKLNRLLALQGVDVEALPVPSEEILALATRDDRIAAIKAYRRQTFAGLKDAKRMIEKYSASGALPDA